MIHSLLLMGHNPVGCSDMYMVFQLDFTPDIEVFNTIFNRCHSKNRKPSIKQYTEYFNFPCKIQLDHPVWKGKINEDL